MSLRFKIQSSISKASNKIGDLYSKISLGETYGDIDNNHSYEADMQNLSLLNSALNGFISENYTSSARPFKTQTGIDASGQIISVCKEAYISIPDNKKFSKQGFNRVYYTYFNESKGKMVVMMYHYHNTGTPNLYNNYISFYEIDPSDNSIEKVSSDLFTHHSSSAYSPQGGLIYSSWNDKYYVFADGTLIEIGGDYKNVSVKLSATSGRNWVGGDVNNQDAELYLIDSLGNRLDIYDLKINTLGTPVSLSATPYSCKYVPNYKKLFIVGAIRLDMMNIIGRVVTNLVNDNTLQHLTPSINSNGKLSVIVKNMTSGFTYLETRSAMNGSVLSTLSLGSAYSDTGGITLVAGFTIDRNSNIYIYSSTANKKLLVYNKTGVQQISDSGRLIANNLTYWTIHKEFNPMNNTLYFAGPGVDSAPKIHYIKFDYICDSKVTLYPDSCSELTEEDVCVLMKKIDVICSKNYCN